MMKIRGGCHCGGVRFEANVPKVVELLDCNCSKCAMTGYLHLIVPHDQFRLLKGGEALSEYRFGTGQARHLFCNTCGIKSFYKPRSHPHAWSVNWRALDRTNGLSSTIRPFDGRNWEQASLGLGQHQPAA